MAKPEEFNRVPVKADDETGAALFEGAYKEKATRVADDGNGGIFGILGRGGAIQDRSAIDAATRITGNLGMGQRSLPERTQVVPQTEVRQDTTGQPIARQQWDPSGLGVLNNGRSLHPTDKWPMSQGGTYPGPNETHWNGNRPDVSRGPGGTVYQPRAEFDPRSAPVLRPQQGPGVAPIAIDATRGPTGRAEGPTILPDTTNIYNRTPSDKGTPGGLIERDGKLVDERSEGEKGLAEFRLAGFLGGILVGAAKGRLKGAIVGGVIGLVATEVLKPLNPFK